MSRPLNDVDRRAEYLGDGLYVDFDRQHVRLFSTDGIDVFNVVFFNSETLCAFENWLKKSMTAQTPYLWSWEHDFGRMGELESKFIATEAEIQAAYGKTAYFGEVLGKHSDISCIIRSEDFTLVSKDLELIKKLSELIGVTISGYNPLEYISE